MSKQKGKAAPKKASKAKAARRPAARVTARSVAAGTGRTLTVTIFIYRTSTGNKIRTSPQRLYANSDDRIEWTVVNLVDGSDVPATITWPDGGPWGKEPIQFRSCERKALDGANDGRYKYVVAALDAQEDPEIEIPEM
jgi:hypothetical protein